jgi:hypothetical protein
MDLRTYREPKIKKGWKACAVSVSNKSVVISSALGGYVGRRVDLYEHQRVFALVNNPEGEYPAIPLSPAAIG